MLTVTGVGPEVLGVTVGVEKEHVDPDGAPPQLKVTGWLNPAIPLRAIV
jgi:hypothetical protein